MSAVPEPDPNEPPPPQRGLTREERGRDVSEAQAEAEAETSKLKQYLRAMSPRFVWSMADGYPVIVKATRQKYAKKK
jgi:YggT family protein